MKAPSTDWKETPAPDEEQKLAAFSAALAESQKRLSQKYGNGRALHRKGLAALAGSLEVLGDLPAHARHGLFATPGRYDVRIRLSNGSAMIQKDNAPDVRAFSLKVLGLDGEGALGGKTTAQDFLLINREVFGFATYEPFLDVALAGMKGPAAVLGLFVKKLGLFAGVKEVFRLLNGFRVPFSGFFTEAFFSAAPIACGPYAVRVRLVPAGGPAAAPTTGRFADDIRRHLEKGSSTHELQLQFFVDEKTTPIEDGSVNWDEKDAPYVTVARLTVPAQDPNSAEGKALYDESERGSYDPWTALKEHRPLGNIMRARKAAYYASQQARKA